MAVLKKNRILVTSPIDKSISIQVEFDVHVSSEGWFSTTIPFDTVEKFKWAEIPLNTNRLSKPGYYKSKTMDGIYDQIKNDCEMYVSSELIDEKIVIKYSIITNCSYCIDDNGGIVPNGRWVGENYQWKEGTERQNATERSPFGIKIFAKPYFKKTYRFKNGKTIDKYEAFSEFGSGTISSDDSRYYLRWLQGLTSIAHENGKLNEIEYNENIAKFFVDAIKGICSINEKIKDLINPESIKELSENNIRLLK
ncbi:MULTISPECIES: hypothetical protein [Olivibacter]|uniref:Uncharacterized protein n=1 Tax=Olivibacter jilunii TaxID=985016 RepID=A0ABW6AZV0_9SPHI